MKLCKWHTMVFRCPSCSNEAQYASQIIEGPHKGSSWDPSYWCEKCESPMRARDKWLFGAVFGPMMAIVGTFAMEAIPPGFEVGQHAALAFAAVCCGIVGWPLSRVLSKHLIFWEPRDPAKLKRVQWNRAREDEE